MNTIKNLTSQSLTLAAAIAFAVAGVTAMTMPTPAPTPTAEPSGDTPAPDLTPTAQYNGFCTLVGSLPGDPPQQNCRRIPVTVMPAAFSSAAGAAR